MKKKTCLFAFALLFLSATTTAWASTPAIAGPVSGIELCPQFICGAAIFVGGFQGQLGANPSASGVIATAMTHTDLPSVGGPPCATITGGVWELKTLFRRVRGTVQYGGTICLGIVPGTFAVNATLEVTGGNFPVTEGLVLFQGFLSHNTPIPTFGGVLVNVP